MNPPARLSERYLIAICAVGAANYCDLVFFERIHAIAKGNQVCIVFGADEEAYYSKIVAAFNKYRNFHFHYVNAATGDTHSSLEQNASAAMHLLRDKFVESGLPYFLFINNDAFVPRGLLKKFERAISYLENTDPNWGILGGLYHRGWSTSDLGGLQKVHHVLSGCTVYNRPLLERYSVQHSIEKTDTFAHIRIHVDAGEDFNHYDGHWSDSLKVESPKTKPLIVRLHK